jgi:predicted secreted protein
MSETRLDWLVHRLEDERSKRVIFVSHCLLNENTRYLGGAFRRGCIDELVDRFQQEDLGIYQMRCPEQRAWGGVLKRSIVPLYGCKGTLLYRMRHVLLPVFLLYTRHIYQRMAKEIVKDIEDYVRSGFDVAGIVGVGGSPSCGVCTTLDLERSIEVIASCPLADIKRQTMNDEAIASCLVKGEGLFIKAIRRQLERKHLPLTFLEHGLLDEMRGQPSNLQTQVLPG